MTSSPPQRLHLQMPPHFIIGIGKGAGHKHSEAGSQVGGLTPVGAQRPSAEPALPRSLCSGRPPASQGPRRRGSSSRRCRVTCDKFRQDSPASVSGLPAGLSLQGSRGCGRSRGPHSSLVLPPPRPQRSPQRSCGGDHQHAREWVGVWVFYLGLGERIDFQILGPVAALQPRSWQGRGSWIPTPWAVGVWHVALTPRRDSWSSDGGGDSTPSVILSSCCPEKVLGSPGAAAEFAEFPWFAEL